MGRDIVGDRFARSGTGHQQALRRHTTFGQVISDRLRAAQAELPVPCFRTRAVGVPRDREPAVTAIVCEVDEPVQYGEGRSPDVGARLTKFDALRNSMCKVTAAERCEPRGRFDDEHILLNRHGAARDLAQEVEARSQHGRVGGYSANLDFPGTQLRLRRIKRGECMKQADARGLPAIGQQDSGIESGFCFGIRELFREDLPERRFVLDGGGRALERNPARSMPNRQRRRFQRGPPRDRNIRDGGAVVDCG